MNVFAHPPFSAALPRAAITRRRAKRGAFALVVTLLILSLLIVVAVSYLTSMVNERQTADAYTSKARAEQVAQAGVDSAMAILAGSLRDFPDSATAWDVKQSPNADGSYNEGTNLYLRAVPTPAVLPGAAAGTTAVVANPQPNGPSALASDPAGNNPNNPACKNFVLPLISGVPGGRAQLVSHKTASIFPKPMDPNVKDPASQIYADLNVRRNSGDAQGVIGSPPDWKGSAPKPARAYWVNMTDNANRQTGRYAFWIEDESFRTNVNAVNLDDTNAPTNPGTPARVDNSAGGKTVVDSSGTPRSVLPRDMFLSGALAGFPTVFNPVASTHTVLDTRGAYPGSFLPEPLAFAHVANGSSSSPLSTAAIDGLRYLTTTQSGSLNLTRHGTQRLNLNAPTTIDAANPVTMPEIRKLVEAIRFHLPNWGQRFYRTVNPDPSSLSTTQKGTSLNNSNDVPAGNSEIYFYKTAANLRDYVDTDDQPTTIIRPQTGPLPTLWVPGTQIAHPFGSDGQGGDGANYMWAQGKDGAPFLQEAVVRYRPAIQIVGTGSTSQANYTLTVDYYVEFWNMSDHDVKASDLHNPYVRISAQQPWISATIDRLPGTLKPTSTSSVPTAGAPLDNYPGDNTPKAGIPGQARDFNIPLTGTVYNAANPLVPIPTGVVFKAGACTVITTDPDSLLPASNAASIYNSRFAYGGQTLVPPLPAAPGFYAPNVYYCPVDPLTQPSAKRTFTGPTGLPESSTYLRGIMPDFRGPRSVISNTYLDFEVEVTLANDLGYLDCASGAVCISAGGGDGGAGSTNGYDFTWTAAGQETHNDYLHGGTLGGNTLNTPSEMGDPRTNNEQLVFGLFAGTSYPAQPDQSRYGTAGKNDKPPFTLGLPNSMYVKPAAFPYPWGDYFDWKTTTYPTSTLDYASAPSVIADAPLTSIGQLGDLFDPARVIGTVGTFSINNSRGGGRTLKIGQPDDRLWYDPTTNPAPNNTSDHVAASNGWASWRLTDVFGIDDDLERPARINVNGVARDGGAALRAALTGFVFQPATQVQTLPDGTTRVVDPAIHGAVTTSAATTTAGASLNTLPPSPSTATPTGVASIVNDIKTRLAATSPNGAYPYGPMFERGELGELLTINGTSSTALFGKNAPSAFVVSNDLIGKDLNHTFDRGREELFRRLVELTCTRGDTFTVYAVGQSLTQTDPNKPAKITGTHRMRVTFRLVPMRYTDPARTRLAYFHPGNTVNAGGSLGVAPAMADPDTATADFQARFAKPDLYDIQVLEVNTL